MNINFSPQRRDHTITVSKLGDVLFLNGEFLDFRQLAEGSTLPWDAIDNEWVIGDVIRKDGHIELTIILPHGPDATEAARFPVPLLDVPDGDVELPV